MMSDLINDALEEIANQASQPPAEPRSKHAKESAEQADQHALNGLLAFINGLNASHDLVWKNPRGLSPQEVVNQWGDGAAQRFADHRSAVQYLSAQKPAAAKLLKQYDASIWSVTANDDGTVTISEVE